MKTKVARRDKIRQGIRKKISGTNERPRVSVFRSNNHIYAQLIDDVAGVTLASVSTWEVAAEKLTKVDASKHVGMKLAEKAKEKGIEKVVFDRGGYLFHGRVKSLAEGAREGGLIF
jgi:large subunit ribosomal protein L18